MKVNTGLKVATVLAVLVVFVTDAYTPLGFAHGMLYLPVLILTVFMDSRRWVLGVGLASALLIIAGVYTSGSAEVRPSVFWTNRLVSLVLVVIVSVLLARQNALLTARRLTIERLDTDRLKLESNARYRQRLFTELTDALPVIVWMADDQGQVDFLNQALADYTGVSISAINLPEGWLELLHPDDREPTMAVWERTVRAGQPYTTEFRIRRHDGHYGHFLVSAKPVGHPEAGLRWYGTATDMDEYRQLQEQLHQARRLESIGQLTGGLAHDFNNLLAVVTGNAGLLRDMLVDRPQARELADVVLQAADSGERLTDSLLAFARRQSLAPRRLELTSLIQSLEPVLRNSVGSAIKFTVSLEPDLPMLVLDQGQLENAMLNLAINARDAMPDGGSLQLSVSRADEKAVFGDGEAAEGADWVIIEMTDTGHGMSDATRQRAFEPFFTTKAARRGTGLGLSQVFGFVTQSGGEVQIESEHNAGTRMRLCFPVVGNAE